MIQGNINQLLQLAGMAARFSPDYEAKAEKAAGQKEVKNAMKRAGIIQKATGHAEGGADGSVGNELFQEALGEYQSGVEKQFKANPTTRGYSDVVSIREDARARARRAAEVDRNAATQQRQDEIGNARAAQSQLLEGTPEGIRAQQSQFQADALERRRREVEENPEIGAPGGN
jgi:hypothetical protein